MRIEQSEFRELREKSYFSSNFSLLSSHFWLRIISYQLKKRGPRRLPADVTSAARGPQLTACGSLGGRQKLNVYVPKNFSKKRSASPVRDRASSVTLVFKDVLITGFLRKKSLR